MEFARSGISTGLTIDTIGVQGTFGWLFYLALLATGLEILLLDSGGGLEPARLFDSFLT